MEIHLNIATPVTVSFDQSQASILTEHFEFDAYVSNPAQRRKVNYNFGTNHRLQKWDGNTDIQYNTNVSCIRLNYRGITIKHSSI